MAEDRSRAITPPLTHQPDEPIPGEYDATTATHREPGAIGGRFSGDDLVSSPDWIDAQTAREEAHGGGRTNRELDKDEETAHGRRTE